MLDLLYEIMKEEGIDCPIEWVSLWGEARVRFDGDGVAVRMYLPRPDTPVNMFVALHEVGHIVEQNGPGVRAVGSNRFTWQQEEELRQAVMNEEFEASCYAERMMLKHGLWNDKCYSVAMECLLSYEGSVDEVVTPPETKRSEPERNWSVFWRKMLGLLFPRLLVSQQRFT